MQGLGNVTGMATDQDVALMAKYLQLLKDVVPDLSRLAGLIDPRARGTNSVLATW
jgi:hypothetical protein